MTTAMVFDPKLWAGKDVGDNSQFWKEADILEVYTVGNDELADVRFHHDGRISRGHFVSGLNHNKGQDLRVLRENV